MGFALSDIFRVRFTNDPAEPEKRIHFLHCGNARHHSLAIFEMPSEAGCIHVMAEVPDMAEVGRALDRVQQHGVKLSATLGQHCNDRMTSFYMKTPGARPRVRPRRPGGGLEPPRGLRGHARQPVGTRLQHRIPLNTP